MGGKGKLRAYKAGHPADLPVPGERANVVFGETLRRHLFASNCRNETPRKRSRNSLKPGPRSSGDPPCRGAEKTALVGSPPVPEGLLFLSLSFIFFLCIDNRTLDKYYWIGTRS